MSEDAKHPIVTAVCPKVLDALQKTVEEAKQRGLAVGIHSALRTLEKQAQLYALGRIAVNPDGKSADKPMGNIVTRANGYDSLHCLGLAGDIVFKKNGGEWTWNVPDEKWNELGVCGELYGLEWGGSWKFKDMPHFQMLPKGYTAKNCAEFFRLNGIDKLWALV